MSFFMSWFGPDQKHLKKKNHQGIQDHADVSDVTIPHRRVVQDHREKVASANKALLEQEKQLVAESKAIQDRVFCAQQYSKIEAYNHMILQQLKDPTVNTAETFFPLVDKPVMERCVEPAWLAQDYRVKIGYGLDTSKPSSDEGSIRVRLRGPTVYDNYGNASESYEW